ncbi:MFS cation transporter [Mycoplasma yeatsii]|uniref:MFS family permease n=1 Tax=Mycoplasma yeatsii TaxID=51365 RepID=A0ABU0NFR2_9MOLU|nr:MFS cation transporter [Mycoplasma yeatsii]MDQ0567779.1 MFS family permease [Mycoplasma yeatsii]
MTNLRWDLYIVNPIIIIIGLVLAQLISHKNKTSRKKRLFFIEMGLFWIAITFLIKINSDAFNALNNSTSVLPTSVLVLFAFIGSYILFAAILNPVAVRWTFWLRQRRIWIWISNLACFFATLTGFLISTPNPFNVIILSILVGIAISSKTIYFLFCNEQYHERLFPIITSIKCGMVITFASFIGTEIYSLIIAKTNTFNAYGTTSLFIIGLICIMLSFAISLMLKERRQNVQKHDDEILESVQKVNKKVIIWLMIIAFLIGIISALIKTPLFEMYIVAVTKLEYKDNANSLIFLKTYNLFFLLGQIVLAYIFYKFIIIKIGIIKSISLLTAFLMIGVVLITFVHNIYLILSLTFLFGLMLFVTFYIWFGIALMWNYRVKRSPIIGIYTSLEAIGFLIPYIIVNILKTYDVGLFQLFKDYESIFKADISQKEILNNLQSFLSLINNAYYVNCSLLFVFMGIYLVIVIWIGPKIIAEYNDLDGFKVKLLTITRKNTEYKMNTRLVRE